MPRHMRAKQFAPFDALKGLQEALRMEEYKHERIEKGDLSQERIEEISNVISNLENGDLVEVEYFIDGYYKTNKGKVKVDIIAQTLIFDNAKICFSDISEIQNLSEFSK